jgi:hypothetical protein
LICLDLPAAFLHSHNARFRRSRYATLEELVQYFDEFDQRKIGRRNVMAIAELLLKWDTDRDGRLSYPEFAAYYSELAGFELSMSPSEVCLIAIEQDSVASSLTAHSISHFLTCVLLLPRV